MNVSCFVPLQYYLERLEAVVVLLDGSLGRVAVTQRELDPRHMMEEHAHVEEWSLRWMHVPDAAYHTAITNPFLA